MTGFVIGAVAGFVLRHLLRKKPVKVQTINPSWRERDGRQF